MLVEAIAPVSHCKKCGDGGLIISVIIWVMRSNEHPCIEQVAHRHSPEELPALLENYISGCDYVCARKIGKASCSRFFRYDPPDESGVMAKQASHDFCLQDSIEDERLALAKKARDRHKRKLQRKRMRGVLRGIARSKKKQERLFIADKNSSIV